MPEPAVGAVFTMSNDAGRNEVLAYSRDSAGQLRLDGTYATGGKGTGVPQLSSQGSVTLTRDGRLLLVANGGSDDVSVFRVRGTALDLARVTASGGRFPSSIAVHGTAAYVLNKGDDVDAGTVSGFRLGSDEGLTALDDALRPLSAVGTDPAQVGVTPDGRTLVVTEEAPSLIGTWPLDADGRPGTGTFTPAAGSTPFGFDVAGDTLVVANAEQGRPGAASLSSYRVAGTGLRTVSGAVGDLRSALCWVVVTPDRAHALGANFGDGTISTVSIRADGSLTLLQSVAGTTTAGQPSVRDAGLTADGRYLYAIDVTSRQVHGWSVGDEASLSPVGAFPGLPATAAGIATT